MVRLGVMYANGWGVEQDFTEALRWYRQAAERGNLQAMRYLADSDEWSWRVPPR
jgi:TPR repeat protein